MSADQTPRIPVLDFEVLDVSVARGVVPLLSFRLRISELAGVPVDAVTLESQIQIEAARRRYRDPREQEALLDIFGEPHRYSKTVRTMVLALATTQVQRFSGTTEAEVRVPSSFDLGLGWVKYFHALEDGDVPLAFQFSGTIFYQAEEWNLQICKIPWDREAAFRMPLKVWKQMIDEHYPDDNWMTLRRDVFDRLYRYKARNSLGTWEDTITALLAGEADAPTPNGGPLAEPSVGRWRITNIPDVEP
ncbi:MAG TPA: DUF6084 family protein [Candidatus Dormibacteraeota bacterium]|nr:DUF6084 family protein [Candidatus Dormibacteraeota bacterium]